MSGDNRSVSTDALQTLGTIITDGGRDAIHLAVEPVTAGETLSPGQDIGLVNGLATSKTAPLLGIVDPFLKTRVFRGDKFWLVVYPRQISSLRHVWSHPDFPDELVAPASKSQNQVVAQNTLYEIAAKLGINYQYFIEAVDAYVEDPSYGAICFGEDLNYPIEDGLIEELWVAYEVVTGKTVKPEIREVYFRCAC